jgi:WD40 repeat protein
MARDLNNTLDLLPSPKLGGSDAFVRLYDATRAYESEKFSVRYRRLNAEVTCLAWAPAGRPFAGIAAVGTADGSISFIDFSIFDQVAMPRTGQPFLRVLEKIL